MSLTKQQRIFAYKIVDNVLKRNITQTIINVSTEGLTEEERSAVVQRAEHILETLRADAKDLWDES